MTQSMSHTAIMDQDTLTSCVLIGIIAFTGLLGNSLMVRALIKYEKLRIDVYVIFGALAVADMIHLCFAVPAKIIDHVRAFEITTDSWCKISRFISNATAYVAAYHIVVLSVLRGIVLTNRGHAPPTAKHALISSTALWVLAVLGSIPAFFSYGKDFATQFCDVSQYSNVRTTVWLEGSFSFFLPLVFIIILYLVTYYIGQRYFSDSYSRHALKMSRLINSIVIAFVVCQCPYQIMNIYLFYYSERDSLEAETNPHHDYTQLNTLYTISDYLYCVLLADRCIRPVLYSKMATDLGETFDEVINCTYCHNNNNYRGVTNTSKKRHNSTNSQAPLTEEPREEIPL